MKTSFICILLCLILFGCSKSEKIEYKEATGYFVRNDAVSGNMAEKITSQEQFDKYFGTAATMSQRPTAIDFSKEFVAAVILAETDKATKIRTDSLIWNGSKLDFYYSILTGEKQTFTTRPVSILIIDRKYDAKLDVTVNETKESLSPAGNTYSPNSSNYEGTYEGTIPCADCSGIELSITLNKDNTYTKTMTYVGKEPNNVFTTKGRYEWDSSQSRITLLDESDVDMYKAEENRLIMLDETGELIEGDLSDMYILRKK